LISRGRLQNILLLLVSSVLAILLAETALRAYEGQPGLANNRDRFRDLFSGATPAVFDSRLGWVPRPGTMNERTYWNTRVTILDDSTRSNGDETDRTSLHGTPILAVGDSFTFGDGVSDEETWPAQLERLLGRPVINGGVFNYGIDQSFLRAGDLIETYHPGILIFSFISDDVRRATLSIRTGVGKPWFDVSAGSLRLMNVPVPKMSRADGGAGVVQRLLGYSLIAHKVLMNYRLRAWYLRGIWDETDTPAHDRGEEVACLIFDQLKRIAQTSGMAIYVVAQYGRWETEESLAVTRQALQCVDRSVVHVVDLLPALSAVRSADNAEYESLFSGHMSPRGNLFVARQLQAAIEQSDAH